MVEIRTTIGELRDATAGMLGLVGEGRIGSNHELVLYQDDNGGVHMIANVPADAGAMGNK